MNCFAATSECLDLPVTALGELVSMGVGLSLTFSADTDEIVTEPVAAPEPAK
ncbi:hypothetical protein FRUB_10054 [Fimbriiglobus ruber]|uniref:Uncharacterized protein n=1 Tax=Fimbriiglobus ruber TaxID=1908690 RepID=A0A225D123_9BACT|nr:hypothetical protein FRUB_10054 [Fimbriiglobus ruber]